MERLTRRNFMKLAAVSGAVLAAGEGLKSEALAGDIKSQQGRDFSPVTGKERQAIPTTCWQCVTRDSMIGFVEDGRLVKIEGHPKSIRSEGHICARGMAGVNQVYDPDRILYPMRRTGARGEGKWKRISWDEALAEVTGRLKKLRDAGTPEKYMFHYGRLKASTSKVVGGFNAAYGTKSIGNHTSICEGGKWSAQEMTWGGHYDNWDFDNTTYCVNFGSNILEAHTNHMPVAHRVMRARLDKKLKKLVTFDVRLSNTAAKSDEWVPIKPGTDSAVILAMCNVVLTKGLYKGEGEEFLKFVKCTDKAEDTVENKIAALKAHFAGYTPEWASKISGVPAAKIEQIATEYANAKPAILMNYRGSVATYNGNEAERGCQLLASLTGNIDNPGGRCKAVGAGWKGPKLGEAPAVTKGLNLFDGFPKGHAAHASFPTHHMNHQVLNMIKDAGPGQIDTCITYAYTAAFANGDVNANIAVLKDESLLPFVVAVDPFYGDSTHYADMILPDATYLERWGWEDMVDPTQTGEFSIRQPLVKPLGESRNYADVCCQMAEMMGFPLGIKTIEEYVQKSCEMTPGVKEAGGFEFMKKEGVWNGGKQKYYSYKTVVLDPAVQACKVGEYVYTDLKDPEAICPYFGDDVLFDKEAGVWWHWKASTAKDADEAKTKGYYKTKGAYKGYVATKIGNIAYAGFKPDKINKSGLMEIYSVPLKGAGHNPLPSYKQAPEHEKMSADDMILTTYKVAVQTQSRSQNCKWLTEIHHYNYAWINSKTAAARGIKDGDKIKLKSSIGEITTLAHVTENIHPKAIAISHHLGHWAYGRYASGNRAPEGRDDADDKNIFWKAPVGVHPNRIILNAPDPINGQQRWMDTVVQVSKA